MMKMLSDLHRKPESYWIRRGQKNALGLFHDMATRVPAYRDFLAKKRIRPASIQTIQDFGNVPTTSKQDYLRQYSLDELSWDGRFTKGQHVISMTSGTSGEPFYFPRTEKQDLQYALLAELYLRTNFEIQKKSTLYIIGFMMGAWIGGLFTYQALNLLAKKGNYNMSIITPGVDKTGIINAVRRLGPYFDQIIIGSYAPFLKDVLDDGVRLGLNWKKYNVQFVFSAEGFSEEVRDYVLHMAGNTHTYTGTLNHYGTVDLGTMAYETPISILVRRTALKNRNVYTGLFGNTNKLPTLTQYIPEHFYFEEVNNTVICSAYSGLPLVRYDLKDTGGVCGFETMTRLFNNNKIDIIGESKKSEIYDTVWKLPFVYVFERSDLMVKFYLCDVYPETIKKALERPELVTFVTGKFTMTVKFNEKRDQYLEIHIELKALVKDSQKLRTKIAKLISDQLLADNEGYRAVHAQIGARAFPQLICWPYEDPVYFRSGTKQKWVHTGPQSI